MANLLYRMNDACHSSAMVEKGLCFHNECSQKGMAAVVYVGLLWACWLIGRLSVLACAAGPA